MSLDSQQHTADDDWNNILDYLNQQQSQGPFQPIHSAEVCQPVIPSSKPPQIIVKDEVGRKHKCAHTAKQIGDQSCRQKQQPVNNHSESPFCRITIRIGVPSSPKTARIWFSRYL